MSAISETAFILALIFLFALFCEILTFNPLLYIKATPFVDNIVLPLNGLQVLFPAVTYIKLLKLSSPVNSLGLSKLPSLISVRFMVTHGKEQKILLFKTIFSGSSLQLATPSTFFLFYRLYIFFLHYNSISTFWRLKYVFRKHISFPSKRYCYLSFLKWQAFT